MGLHVLAHTPRRSGLHSTIQQRPSSILNVMGAAQKTQKIGSRRWLYSNIGCKVSILAAAMNHSFISISDNFDYSNANLHLHYFYL
jgi:hypothetical protein